MFLKYYLCFFVLMILVISLCTVTTLFDINRNKLYEMDSKGMYTALKSKEINIGCSTSNSKHQNLIYILACLLFFL